MGPMTRLFVLAALALAASPAVGAAPKWPVARGSFIQDYLVAKWTVPQWEQEYARMKQVGMDILIFGSVCDSKLGVTYYPTRVQGLRQSTRHDNTLGKCLEAAEKTGMKVFVGLNFHGDWWRKGGSDPAWLNAQMEQGNALADDILAQYGTKYPRALAGWYWVWEVDNITFSTPERRAVLAEALDINVKHLHRVSPKMPVILCPFMNYKVGASADYGEFWKQVFAQVSFQPGDIFCPQDCVGAGGLTLDRVPEWFAALAEAVKTKPGLRFWSDTETFDQTDWTSATLDRFVAQMKAVRPFVQDCVTFTYNHYYSPVSVDPGFQKTLTAYVRTGRLEKTPPTAPSRFRATRRPDGTVQLDWAGSTDNVGVCGYDITRDGVRITRMQGKRGGPTATRTRYIDDKAPKAGPLAYAIRACDFAGNLSKPVVLTVP